MNRTISIYAYRISDFFPNFATMNVDLGEMKSSGDIESSLLQYANYSLDGSAYSEMVNVVYSAFFQFCYESYQRIVWCESFTLDENPSDNYRMLLIRCSSTITEFCEKYKQYLKLLKEKESNLLDAVKTGTKYKQANADTPVTKKFDSSYTIDDYISWMTLNQSESSNDFGTIIQRLEEIRNEYRSLSKELKELLECNVIVYNVPMEVEDNEE